MLMLMTLLARCGGMLKLGNDNFPFRAMTDPGYLQRHLISLKPFDRAVFPLRYSSSTDTPPSPIGPSLETRQPPRKLVEPPVRSDRATHID
jgi:hypothetical protein